MSENSGTGATAGYLGSSTGGNNGGATLTPQPSTNTTGSRSTLHAYEVALKTTRDKCQRQAEQLRARDLEARRLLADKSALHTEIDALRQSAGRQRDKASQLHREVAARHRECQQLRDQTAALSRQLHAARRRLEAAGIGADDLAPPSLEQANRSTDEVQVQVPVATPVDSPDVESMTEEEVDRRLQQLEGAARRSLQDGFQQTLQSLRAAAAAAAASPAAAARPAEPQQLRRAARTLRDSNGALRRAVDQLLRLRDAGRVAACAAAAEPASAGSLPPLHEIPLSCSPPASADPAAAAGRLCPLCALCLPASQYSQDEFEDHVYAHVVDMVMEDGCPPRPATAAGAPPPAPRPTGAVHSS